MSEKELRNKLVAIAQALGNVEVKGISNMTILVNSIRELQKIAFETVIEKDKDE